MSDLLYCGAAKEKITPKEETWKNLCGLMNRKFGGVLDDLYVRVIYLKNETDAAVLISFDLDKVPCPEKFLALVQQEAKVPEENILLAAVHTHTAPIAGNRTNEGPNNFANKPPEVQEEILNYESFLQEKLQMAVQAAMEHAVLAKYGFATGESFINVDRKFPYEFAEPDGSWHRKVAIGENGKGNISHTLSLLRFEDYEGKPIAFFVNYPVHCAVLNGYEAFGDKLGFSGDIAGRISAWNEENFADSVTVWCSGAAGDINPYIKTQMEYPDPKTGRMSTKKITENGYELLEVIAAKHYDDLRKLNRQLVCAKKEMELGGKVSYSITEGNMEPFKIRLHMMKLGDIYLLGASGELFDLYAKAIQERIASQVIVINHDASLLGDGSYIADDTTLLQFHPQLPGMMHPNQKPGLFMQDFLKKSVEMLEALDPSAKDPEPKRPPMQHK